MTGIFNQIKLRSLLGAFIATSFLSFSVVAMASEEKSNESLVLESQLSTLKSQRAQHLHHINKDLLPQFDKGGPDWKPIDAIVMHELNQEILDYNFLRGHGDGSQLGEMQDELVGLLADSGAFNHVQDSVLAVLVQNLTAKNAINVSERKVYLNKMRFQIGVSESKHLSSLLEELQGTRMKVVGFDRKIAKLQKDLDLQLKLDTETKK